MKTIATISTPFGVGAIGIIRMSGDDALSIASKLFSTQKLFDFTQAEPNYMYYGTLDGGRVRDKILAVYFKAPYSYTGEDVVEFQCHGGMKLLQEALDACLKNGAVVADKGEFTKRAFLNGKMALGDCEGIIDMINGESVSAINAGFRLADGDISKEIKRLQTKLLDSVSELEASLDYPDEMEEESKQNCAKIMEEQSRDLEKLVASAKVGKYISSGISVAILGLANVGKSSLLNKLLGRERAIVTEIAGTTRDSLEENIEVNGVLLKLIDTAGIRAGGDKIEAIGIEKSFAYAKSADIILFLTEADRDFSDEEVNLLTKIEEKENIKMLIVVNKSDLLGQNKNEKKAMPNAEKEEALAIEKSVNAVEKKAVPNAEKEEALAVGKSINAVEKKAVPNAEKDEALAVEKSVGKTENYAQNRYNKVLISAKTGDGIEELKQTIVDIFLKGNIDASTNIITNNRHASAIKEALDSIRNASEALGKMPTECVLVDLKNAYFALGKITGESASESIIDTIFAKFCLGK